MKLKDFAELLLLAMLWGASFLFMRVSVPEFGAIPLMLVRVTSATMFLLPIILWKNKQQEILNNLKPIAFVGLFGSAIPFTLIAYSTLYVTSGFASVVNAATPIFTALVAFVWLGQRLTRLAILGLIIGLVGVTLLVWDKISFNQANLFLAVIAGISATIFYGVSANYSKKNLVGVSPLSITTGSLFIAALVLLPFAIVQWPQQMPSTISWLNVLTLALACTAFAQVLFFKLVDGVGPTNATSVTFLIPGFGLFWGHLFLNEAVELSTLFAGLVILLGTGLTTGMIKAKKLVQPS
jgi:drug/metabolite transporter (DMT)-like permease